MSATKTYDPSKVVVSFAGNLLTGFSDGTFISVERNEDGFSLAVGAGGEAARVQNRNRSGKVTLTLQASSQTNDILAAIAAADEMAGVGVSALFIKEVNGTMLCAAANSWIVKLPKVERAKELSTVEWTFECESLEIFAGGLI